jgi:hypothetical protein
LKVFDDAGVGSSKTEPGAATQIREKNGGNATPRSPSVAQPTKGPARGTQSSASPQVSPVPSSAAASHASGSPNTTSNQSRFGRAMIDDEKRKAQAALLDMTVKGQSLGSARSGANPSASTDIKFWACSSSGCDTLNPADRNKCGEYSGTRFAIVVEYCSQRNAKPLAPVTCHLIRNVMS